MSSSRPLRGVGKQLTFLSFNPLSRSSVIVEVEMGMLSRFEVVWWMRVKKKKERVQLLVSPKP